MLTGLSCKISAVLTGPKSTQVPDEVDCQGRTSAALEARLTRFERKLCSLCVQADDNEEVDQLAVEIEELEDNIEKLKPLVSLSGPFFLRSKQARLKLEWISVREGSARKQGCTACFVQGHYISARKPGRDRPS